MPGGSEGRTGAREPTGVREPRGKHDRQDALRCRPCELIAVTSRSDDRYSPLAIETPLNPGKQFLLLTVSREDKSHPLELDRCLVLSDTPEIRNQLEAGVAQNDSLRYPDPRS